MKFKYPDEFKNKVKRLYPEPEYEKLHCLLEAGSIGRLGLLLQELDSAETIAVEEILNINTLEELQALKKKVEKGKLYAEWAEIAYTR